LRFVICFPFSPSCLFNRARLATCLVSRHYFSKSRSRRSEVSISVSSRHLEVSENGNVSAVFFYFSNGTILAPKYAEGNPVLRLPNNIHSVILWRPMVVKSQWWNLMNNDEDIDEVLID